MDFLDRNSFASFSAVWTSWAQYIWGVTVCAWLCIVSQTSWAHQVYSRNTDHPENPHTKISPSTLPRNQTLEWGLKDNLPPQGASWWFLSKPEVPNKSRKSSCSAQVTLPNCRSECKKEASWKESLEDRGRRYPKECQERLPVVLKKNKFCGRGLFFLLFEAGPDNFLNKLTCTVCHFQGWQTLCFQRTQQIWPGLLQGQHIHNWAGGNRISTWISIINHSRFSAQTFHKYTMVHYESSLLS